jgi:pyruvate kinase
MSRTKIICTIGPATQSPDQLERLVDAGMNVARLNFSYGTHEEFETIIASIRSISDKKHIPIAIIQDLQGPKIRVGNLKQALTISAGEHGYIGQKEQDGMPIVPIQYNFIPYLQKGHTIYFSDGDLQAKVEEISNDYAEISFTSGGTIQSDTGINIPDTHIPESALTDKDIQDVTFGVTKDIEYVALSFVQNSGDIDRLRVLLQEKKATSKIIAKIETKGAIEHLDEIIQHADAVMVARGDLALAVGIEQVPLYQLEIIHKCRKTEKPVIVATQMLESMIINSEPTRAEASDVANAALSQVDAVMLSGESAIGKYPIEAAAIMNRIIEKTEEGMIAMHLTTSSSMPTELTNNHDAISAAATLLVNQMHSDVLAVATHTGVSALSIASLRPQKTIVVITPNKEIYTQLALVWGIHPFLMDKPKTTIDDLVEYTTNQLLNNHHIQSGSKVILVTGLHVGIEGETNSVRIIDIT